MTLQNWETVKIGAGGFCTGINASPTGSVILIRTDTHGAYRWNSATSEWVQLINATSMASAAQFPDCWSGVTEIVCAPSLPSRLYMAFMGDVYRSDDTGDTWTVTTMDYAAYTDPSANGGRNKVCGQKMAVDPANPDVVYFGTPEAGVYYTVNGGTNWTQIANGTIPFCTTQLDNFYPGHPGICFDPTSGTTGGKTNKIYIPSYGNGVYQSTNAGSSWAALSSGPTQVTHAKIDQNGNYYATQIHAAEAETLYKWNGSAFSAIGSGVRHIDTVLISPSDANYVVAVTGGGYLEISEDAGATWESPIMTHSRVSADIPWLAWTEEEYMSVGDAIFDPATPGQVILSQGIGVWTTPLSGTPASTVWTSRSKGIENLTSNTVICPPNGYPILAAWDRSCFTVINPEVYPDEHSPTNDIAIRMAWDVDYASSDPAYIAYLSNYAAVATHKFGWYSTDKGLTWAAFATSPGATGTIALQTTGNWTKSGGCLAISTPLNIVAVPSNSSLPWYTKDGGTTWTEIEVSGVATSGETGWGWAYYNPFKCVTADRVNANTFYLYNYLTQGLYRSTDSGDSWTKMNTGNIDVWAAINTQLKAVPGQAGHLFLAGGKAGNSGDTNPGQTLLSRSTDGGATWSAVANVEEAYCVGFGAAAPGQSYPAVYFTGWLSDVFGIWRSVDNCSTWEKIGDYPGGSLDWMESIDASKEVYGTVYGSMQGSGYVYSYADASAPSPSGGGGAAHPTKIKHEKERRERLKKNELAIEQTIRLAHQRISGKVTEPEILKQEASPQRLAVHAEKLAAQLVEKSKDSAKQRTRNKAIIAELKRQAQAIMQEEEEAIIMLLH